MSPQPERGTTELASWSPQQHVDRATELVARVETRQVGTSEGVSQHLLSALVHLGLAWAKGHTPRGPN
jgi:hypothetical protein